MKKTHQLDFSLFLNMSKQIAILSASYSLVSCKPGTSRELVLRPPIQGLKGSTFSKLVFDYMF